MYIFIRFGEAEAFISVILLKACEELQVALIAAMRVNRAVGMCLGEGKDRAGIVAVRVIAFAQQVYER